MKPRSKTNLIVIHCSATPPSMDIGAEEIRRWHVEDNGWSDIGYHFVIKRTGELEYGRELKNMGAHVAGYNATSVGICLVGGVDGRGNPASNFTRSQFKALREVLRYLRGLYVPDIRIVGHRDIDPKKACPSFDVAEWLQQENITNGS